ncbi:SRPBCC family protein [Soonwooa sp.]|uniref:SRPBCC family protein n=1 Tax=Soonwooa sp. TaxID=1938592 RepID=UPI00261C2478|nr:SRPBCC family protein [Soonwooa sp.]
MKKDENFTATIIVEQSPEIVFSAINNVRGWWSKNIDGSTEQLNSEFVYRDKYLTAKIRITQITPQKIAWKVLESHNTFFGDKYEKEWDGTQMIFEITEKGGKTEITFTHLGLIPQFECFNVCSNSWNFFITESLKSLIETGKGNDISKDENSYTTSILVNNSPEEVYKAVNNVRGWWSEEIEGKTDELQAEFFYHYKDVHLSKMLVVELIPNKKVVWFVKDNEFNFVNDKTEWKGTKIVFEISKIGDKTQLIFTHHGLVPENECYEVCNDAWTSYIQGSLQSLITTGQGKPNAKEGGLNAELVEKWSLPKK